MEIRTRSGQENTRAGAPSTDVAPGPPQLSRPFGGLLDGIPVGVYRTTPTGVIVDGRYGGEEFAVIMPEASLETTRRRANDLREGIKELAIEHRGQLLGGISASAGVAAFPFHGSTGEAVLHAADAALYSAKGEGRDRVVVAEIKQT